MAQVLRGGLATLPLALLGDLSGTSPEEVVQQVAERLSTEVAPDSIRKLWTSTYLLARAIAYQFPMWWFSHFEAEANLLEQERESFLALLDKANLVRNLETDNK